MQFFKSTVLFALTFVTFVAAAPTNEDSVEPRGRCVPLLNFCSVNSECCGDLCLLGVSAPSCHT